MKESSNLNSDQEEFLKTNLTLFLSRVIKTIMGLVKERNYRRKQYPRYTKIVTILDVRAALMLLEYPIPDYLNKLRDNSRDMALLKQENTITKDKRKSTRRLIKSDQIIQDSE